jgi:pSer/pThr/pTyr-binding forkhead associated (FHA) protein/biotin carboxyl carrier protein
MSDLDETSIDLPQNARSSSIGSAYLIVESSIYAGTRLPIRQNILIGRGKESQLRLKDAAGVSRNHTQIYFHAGECSIEDAGSRNGTYLNGIRVADRVRLKDGDVVQIGECLIRFHDPANPNQMRRRKMHRTETSPSMQNEKMKALASPDDLTADGDPVLDLPQRQADEQQDSTRTLQQSAQTKERTQKTQADLMSEYTLKSDDIEEEADDFEEVTQDYRRILSEEGLSENPYIQPKKIRTQQAATSRFLWPLFALFLFVCALFYFTTTSVYQETVASFFKAPTQHNNSTIVIHKPVQNQATEDQTEKNNLIADSGVRVENQDDTKEIIQEVELPTIKEENTQQENPQKENMAFIKVQSPASGRVLAIRVNVEDRITERDILFTIEKSISSLLDKKLNALQQEEKQLSAAAAQGVERAKRDLEAVRMDIREITQRAGRFVVRAPQSGVVKKIHVTTSSSVQANQLLLEIQP